MKKPRHTISDHAVLRYLERAQGVDVEAVRRELGRRVDAAAAEHQGLCAVHIEGMRFAICEDGTVSTVWPSHTPKGYVGRPRHRKDIP